MVDPVTARLPGHVAAEHTQAITPPPLCPTVYKELMTGKTARKIIAILWILSFVIGLIPFFGWNLKYSSCRNSSLINSTDSKHRDLVERCRLSCLFESVVDMQYMVYFNFFVCVLVPLLIMLGIYVKIFTVARKQLRQIELKCVGNGDNQNQGLLQKEIRAAKSLSIIVGLFAVCWLPVHILNCLKLFYSELKRPDVVMYVAIILSHANSAVNPIIYAYRIQDFRNTFRKILAQNFLCHKEELYLSSNGSRRNRDQIKMTTDPLL
ncbi:Adenosine receptor A2b [Crenichthys baileyi]|uniref:Adenosine receptor A2b n=1 Tax=Crenichthys baileyi TaxID=28760 RepID=A0AAV9SGT8_9TELE